jgi:hypothetical protein
MGWKAPESTQDSENGVSGAVGSVENENAAMALIQALNSGG